MNKTTTWLLAALLPAVAAAEVRFYGNIRSGIEVAQTKIGSERHSRSSVSDFGSHIGLSGSHPIGGKTHAVWQFEENMPTGRSSGHWRSGFHEKKADGRLHTPD